MARCGTSWMQESTLKYFLGPMGMFVSVYSLVLTINPWLILLGKFWLFLKFSRTHQNISKSLGFHACVYFFSGFGGCRVFMIFRWNKNCKTYLGYMLSPGGTNWQLIYPDKTVHNQLIPCRTNNTPPALLLNSPLQSSWWYPYFACNQNW